MKRTNSILFVCLLFCLSKATAQTYYYNQSDKFCESGYCYRWDTSGYGVVMLYNADNQHTYTHSGYQDGAPDNFSGINSLFSDDEKQRIAGEELDIHLLIDTATGQIIEVAFGFYPTEAFATIPLSTYRKIESELKTNVRFAFTDREKQQDFVRMKWLYAPA